MATRASRFAARILLVDRAKLADRSEPLYLTDHLIVLEQTDDA